MAQEPGSTGAAPEVEQNLALSSGRKFQTTNDAYYLPTDSGEHSRLDLQHEALRLMLDGELYQAPELVKASLAIEMAEEFPHADVLGIDLVQPNILSDPTRRVPPNCSFQIADANKDMEKIDSVYDLVHMRCVEAGLHDSDLFFYDAARVLRPGGLLLLVGAEVQLVDENAKNVPLKKPGDVGCLYQGSPPESWESANTASVLEKVWKLLKQVQRPSDKDVKNYDVQIHELLVPPGPWSNNLNETERKLAETMQTNLLRIFPAFKAILLRDNSFNEEFVNSLAENAMNEVRELPPVVHRYTKWVFATAVRNDVPWTSRKKPWQEPQGYNLDDYIVRLLPEEGET
ncbi:hypothetical protein M407DRAFT_9326 [Tulasnella calospora MUT 4182]|uniref:Methyltransferase domain-containing protein n=1 Tax=Tulasnella calospora MUT 4182 TaxID=1051891 RepID=A0A0C3Q473_9AGAM|nr:hypothetical protein M407DRAFT_9326 [Tulasnella calospora MUT 4182]